MDPARDDALPEIPRLLHSVHRGAPFTTCIECGGAVIDMGLPYGVEKVVRNGEVVFEYAICAACTYAMMREFSQESLQRIADYVESARTDLRSPDAEDLDRYLRALEGDAPQWAPDNDDAVNHCQRCGRTGLEFEEEHSIVGLLTGKRLVTRITTICSKCTDGMGEVLSRKTRDAHDGFIRRNFPGVPSTLDIPVGVMSL